MQILTLLSSLQLKWFGRSVQQSGTYQQKIYWGLKRPSIHSTLCRWCTSRHCPTRPESPAFHSTLPAYDGCLSRLCFPGRTIHTYWLAISNSKTTCKLPMGTYKNLDKSSRFCLVNNLKQLLKEITRETNQASPVKSCLQNQCLYFHTLYFQNNISTSYIIDHCYCPYSTIQVKLMLYKLPHTSGKTWQIPGFVFMNG